jgi:uncharacterized repeat protein (TIGR04052 family)
LVAVLLAATSALGASSADVNGMCVGDADASGNVTVDELVSAVRNALHGCALAPVTLRFAAVVGDQPFACGNSYPGIGTTAVDLIPGDLRLYVHDVRLVADDGRVVAVQLAPEEEWQYEDLALLDFEDKTGPCGFGTPPTNTTVRGVVPPGDYRGVRFALGVPFALNHQNPATAPVLLRWPAMLWSWQGGYKFLRIDDGADTVRVHIGSTGCEYGEPGRITSCARPNRGEVWLADFNPDRDTIVFDLAALFADSDLRVNHPDTAPGCESSPIDSDCEPLMRNLGINFANGLPDPSRQRAFRVRRGE